MRKSKARDRNIWESPECVEREEGDGRVERAKGSEKGQVTKMAGLSREGQLGKGLRDTGRSWWARLF